MAVVSRLKLNHPALGTAGGAALHTQIESLYAKIGDNMADRFVVIEDLSDSESADVEHNFNTEIENLRYDLYEIDVATGDLLQRLTRQSTPSLSDFSVVEKVGSEKTHLTVTNSSGSEVDLAFVIHHDPIELTGFDLADVDNSTPIEEGQTYVYDEATGKMRPGASGDASFKVQSVQADGTTVIKGGYLIDDLGREYATYDGSGSASTDYGQDISIDLDALVPAPTDDTTYFIYIDKSLADTASIQTDTGRSVYGVTQSELVALTLSPEQALLERYIPLGFVRRGVGVWSESVFGSLAFRRHQGLGVLASPLVETIGPRAIGTVGAVDNLAGGHVLDADSFPALTTSQLSFYNLAANANDGFHTRALTNNNAIPFTGTSTRGAANAAAVLNGTNQNFSSTDAFFNPGNGVSWSVGGWFHASDWQAAGAMSILSAIAGASDRKFNLSKTAASFFLEATNTAAAWDAAVSIPNTLAAGWHHLSGVFSHAEGALKLYIDGILVGSAALANTRALTSPIFRVGARFSTAEQFFGGRSQDVFFAQAALTDEDIQKLASVRLDLADGSVPAEHQRWTAEFSKAGFKNQYSEGWLLDKRAQKIYVDFGGAPAAGEVTLRKYDTSLGARAVPVRNFHRQYISDPGTTIPHGLPAMPTSVAVLYDEEGNGRYRDVSSDVGVKVDAANIYLSLASYTIDASKDVVIVASVGTPAVAIPTGYKRVTTAYTAQAGDKLLTYSDAAAFTVTLPPSPSIGAEVELADAEDTWATKPVTLARNGQLVEGLAEDMILSVSGKFVKAIFVGGSQGWRIYA